MGTGAITQYVDVAQVAIDSFWIFFAGILYYLHREDKREGYPLESDRSRSITVQGWPAIPSPKRFDLPNGEVVYAPAARTSTQTLNARPVASFPGAPLEPVGNPLLAGVGPGSWTERADVPDETWDRELRVVPLRSVPDFGVDAGDTDPRGLQVLGADGVSGGVVRDLWVDRSDVLFRYLEVESTDGARVMVPITFCIVGQRAVKVDALLGSQLQGVPRLANPDRITRLEEERIVAYFGAGTLYATPDRQEPLF